MVFMLAAILDSHWFLFHKIFGENSSLLCLLSAPRLLLYHGNGKPRTPAMKLRKIAILTFVIVTIIFVLSLTGSGVFAQDEDVVVPYLVLTGSDASSPPTIQLQVIGVDSQGNAIDFNGGGVVLKENGAPVDFQVTGTTPVGTLTVFLIDVPGGVAEQIPAIQDAIKSYASAGNMAEGTDYVAIYKISETGPVEVLAPTNFYNSVQNAFSSPLEPETGATALVDSTMAMLNQMESLKPDPKMQAALVVMSDGTDVVSSQFTTTDVAPHAASLGIPVHTVWLDNVELGGLSIGRDYLAEVAASARGTAVQLHNTDELSRIWNRITGLRDHVNLSYLMDNPQGGSMELTLSLADYPDVQVSTNVEVSGSLPSVTIELPIESRMMSLPNLDDPVKLKFTTSVSWLDGVERQLEAAQLIVNGTVVADIPVQDINNFETEVNNLTFGENTIQVAILDEQGIPVNSPPVNLTVQEGSREVPEELDAGGVGSGSWSWLIWLILLVALGLVGFYVVRRYDLLARVKLPSRGGKRRSGGQPAVATYDEPSPKSDATPVSETPPVVTMDEPVAYLEVLDSVTRMPDYLELKASQISLGRSPGQSDIAFENDITVSRIHATLHLEGTHFRIFDERSTSGTWVNEQQVPEYGIQLMDGDEVHLGAVHLRYREA